MKLFFVSLGCDKNLVDSEKMLALLAEQNIEITEEPKEAEIIIVNTCGFIHDAKEESIETILEMAEYKKTGKCISLIVTGCLAQRYAEEMQKEIEEVDVVVGTAAYDRIFEAVKESLEGRREPVMESLDYLPKHLTRRLGSRTGSYSSYLKIAEGCNKRCTYCIIPYLRGNYRSVPMEELLEEASMLAEQGTKELIVIAQETTVYGVDIYGEKRLPQLLEKLCEIKGIQWIRVMYCYPEEITDELIDTIAEEEKVCHYLDIPIQHSEDPVLRRMGRCTCKKDIVELIAKLRIRIPDIAIRTTLIAGFPGETEADHEALMEFVNESEFDRLGVFTYSPEEGTPAASFPNQIENEVAEKWRDDIMALQQEVSYDKNQELLGKSLTVLIEGYVAEDDVYVGRTYRDAPDVDGMVFVDAPYELMSGTFVQVRITDANEYDLTGEMIE